MGIESKFESKSDKTQPSTLSFNKPQSLLGKRKIVDYEEDEEDAIFPSGDKKIH